MQKENQLIGHSTSTAQHTAHVHAMYAHTSLDLHTTKSKAIAFVLDRCYSLRVYDRWYSCAGMRVSVCLELELEQYVLTATKIFERQNSQNFNGSVSFAKATNTNVKFTRGVREIRSIVLFVIRRNHGKWHFDIFGYFCFTAAAAFHLTYQVCVSVCVCICGYVCHIISVSLLCDITR